MEIYGREYGFKLTVGASAEIAALCPEGELSRLGELLKGSFSQTMDINAALICAMSKGYEEAKSFEEPGYTPAPLTRAMVMSLDMPAFSALTTEALTAFKADKKPTVEIEPEKPSKKNDAAGEAEKEEKSPLTSPGSSSTAEN